MWVRLTGAVVALVAVLAILIFASNQTESGWVRHALAHLSGASIGGFFLVLGRWEVREPLRIRWKRQIGPPTAIVGLAIFTGAQLVESVSAWTERAGSGALHDGSGFIGAFALAIIPIAVLLWIFEAVLKKRASPWSLVIVAVIGIGLPLLFAGGLRSFS